MSESKNRFAELQAEQRRLAREYYKYPENKRPIEIIAALGRVQDELMTYTTRYREGTNDEDASGVRKCGRTNTSQNGIGFRCGAATFGGG